MGPLNFSNIKIHLNLRGINQRQVISILLISIGFIEVVLPLIYLYPYGNLDSLIKIVFIPLYGIITLINGIAGFVVRFKTDYFKLALISRYLIIILIFIPYVSTIASLLVNDLLLLAFRANALLLSLICLIDLFTIPILKHFYDLES